MSQIYDTCLLDPSDQFDYWREELCHIFVELAPERTTNGLFKGAICQQPLSEIMVSRVTADPHYIKRTSHEISKSSDELFFANLQVKGTGRTRQGGLEIITNPGDLVMIDACEPYDVQHDEAFELISVKIPYSLLENEMRLHDCRSIPHVPSSKGISPLLRNYTETLLDDFSSDISNTTSLLAENLVSLISISLNTSNTRLDSEKLTRQHYSRLQDILGYINCHLANPELNLQQVANHFGLSNRYVQKLFAATGTTFSRVVLDRRLIKCAFYFRSPQYRMRKLSEVAFAWGLNDFSYFSRTFKNKYGCSPREYRKKNVARTMDH